MSLAANFIGGAAGSVLEQKIGSGSVSLKESIVSGAATAGIRYLARDWDEGGSDLAGSVLGLAQGIGQMAISPYAKNRDPRRGCGVRSPLSNRVGEAMAYGYRYDVGSLKSAGSVRGKKEGFSMLGLLKEAAVGGVMGGLAGTAFYGAGKAFGFLKDSVRDVRGNKGGSSPQAISNKFPNDNQKGKTFDYTIENGNVKIRDGIQEADFVIDMDGNLHIGRGHSYLANGNSVQAAGKMKVNSQGYIRNIINDSGHYQPTVSEALNYPNILRSAGLNVDNAWIRVDSFTSSLSNYVIDSKVFYNGPVKYLPH